MNPPSALFSAMNRERKPFTYTPGGLDLSEIKSERMAKRLMRNAMNQGVPEVPIQQIQSPPTPSTPIAVPNFNCLPVQVFPTFNLPANPKSLLRTRSNPEHPKEPTKGVHSPSLFAVNNSKLGATQTSTFPLHLPSNVPQTNNVSQNRPASMYDYNNVSNSFNTLPRTNYESNGSTVPILPPISYEAEYFQTPLRNNNGSLLIIPEKSDDIIVTVPIRSDPIKSENSEEFIVRDDKLCMPLKSDSETVPEKSEDIIVTVPSQNASNDLLFIQDEKLRTPLGNDNSISETLPEKREDNTVTIPIKNDIVEPFYDEKPYIDFEIQPISNPSAQSMPVEDEVTSDSEQKEVKVVKKQVKKEQKIENGEQNGDANVEAELVVKLPAKKSAAKTETKVEVHKTILPDGTVEEVKVTTTKTTIDGKTEIKTKTEKTIIPKEEVEEVEEEEEEEQEETSGAVQVVEEVVEEPEVIIKKTIKETPVLENGQKETIIKKKESVETSTTKKVVVVQKEESEEEEEEDEPEPEPVVVKKLAEKPPSPKPEIKEVKNESEVKEEVEEEIEAEDEAEEEVEQEEVTVIVKKPAPPKQDDEEEVEEEEYEEAEEKKVEKIQEKVETKVEASKEDPESEYTEEEYESEKEEAPVKEPESKPKEVEKKESEPETETKEKDKPQEEASKPEPKEEIPEEPVPKSDPISEPKVPLREPSIPLEKVEEVEIKPIGPASEVISKTHSENTEIITNTTQKPTGPLSTQTEQYSRVENIVTVNRTTKSLDQSYEQMTQAGIPTVRTYFAPSRERIGTSPIPSKPYQPVYAPEPPTERRHSLLLDRLSTERQIPTSDIYQNTYQNTYNNQSYEQQTQWSQEPQSEVLNVSNVKPSKITNSQWYQPNQRENVIYNNVTPSAGIPPSAPTPAPVNQAWSQPPPQQQPQYQSPYIDSTAQERTLTNAYQPTNYPAYVPKPTNWASDIPSVNTNQYLYKDTTENYQKSTQQYSSSYVPPPWEQDSNYVLGNTNQNYYEPPPQSNTYTPSPNQGWKPTPPPNKFTKPPPTAYIPPAPNQSFVKSASVVEPPRLPGRKTYYSEYERRYITVPESTYIPGETAKFQPQPDPSPQYYYDNNEQSEKVEHEWRKELREFTEKTSQTTEQTSTKPPWEEDTKYAKTPTTYTPTPTWSQTLRPRSWRERSFESEYVGSQELPKTNTLGRGRPLSSYGKAEAPTPDRARGVSVDRYNPNYYQSPIPSEHPPVPIHTLAPTPAAKAYHNPNVPAYHAHPRASAEPRDHPVPIPQARLWGSDARGSPVQSRSFKYLQWITGTED